MAGEWSHLGVCCHPWDIIIILFLFFIFLYPWVYSSQGLKAIKTVIIWLLVWIAWNTKELCRRTALNGCNARQTLEQERSFSFFARHTADFIIIIITNAKITVTLSRERYRGTLQ